MLVFRRGTNLSCRYGEVIFTGIFSQLALPTSIHRFTGDNRCQNPDGPLTRKST
ncbi:IS66 family insertion sequence hypothetical protein, partial [Salmonella enterica subsp. enterica]